MNEQPSLESTIGNLTRGQLEQIVEEIAERKIRQQMVLKNETDRGRLMATFGTWQDERSAAEISHEIYASRNSNWIVKYLLDTDICIYWLKGNTNVKAKIELVEQSDLAICVITASELYFGAYNSSKIEPNLQTARAFVRSIAVLSLTDNALQKFSQLKARLRQAGTPVADFALLIASVAIAFDLILITNNTRHYQRITELSLDNWST